MEKVFASIITIGDELLIGQVVDTNSAWMAQELNKIGICLKHRVAVGDVREDIWQVLDEESRQVSVILITGGLGPTADDITKPLLCDYFGGRMVVHAPTLDHITILFERALKRPMIERNARQAEVPDVCTVLKNEKGTAPGMLFKKDGKIFIALPGVPHEMKWIMTNQVLPILLDLFQTGFIEHRTLLTAGIGESFLAELVQDIEESLPAHIKLAYLPNYGMVRMRLTAFGPDKNKLGREIDMHFQLFKEKVKEFLVIDEDLSMELVVARLLKKRDETLSTAESCTGGNIARMLTRHAGASAYYKGTVVSYANSVKQNVLQVSGETLQTVGAVSEATAQQMARSILRIMQTDYAIAVSGIMGPEGGTSEKPVGMVWIAVANKDRVTTKQFHFRFDRARNIELTSINALNLLRIFIIENR
jgi:nicotinamide-nucleotide amidase